MVPLSDARLHFHTLTAAGWSLRAIAAHAGVDATSVSRFMRHGDELPHVEAGILRIDPTALPERTNHDGEPFVSRIGTTRRLQALLVMGWTAADIGARIGKSDRWVHNKMNQQGRWVRRSTHDLVVKVYRELSSQRGPSELTRSRALARGYVSPAAWEDIDTDEAPEKDDRLCSIDGCLTNAQWIYDGEFTEARSICSRHEKQKRKEAAA